ncbi:hypothetical protein [Actinoplanes sp. DH11]|uniref:hypothetical protein n=1 Tax=Actinoplanes sp. DH11 TaxID=2857011 RepID=UPI001E577F27|nr:hypothetical protein [Actinoplanes sp. DH11]
MGLDNGGATPYSNPYAGETARNTDAAWIDANPLKVDVAGLRDYAKDMLDQQRDLNGRKAHLTELMSGPSQAWEGLVLGEAAFLRSQMAGNAAELMTYLDNLGQALFNIGSAAQTIADIYGTSDAAGAADLNDVLFAFGDKSVPRPAGLPPHVGQTYDEAVRAAAAQAGPAATENAAWGPATTTSSSPYAITTVATQPTTGDKRETVTINIPGGGTVVTTTIFNAKGEVVSKNSTRTTTTYDSATNTQVKTVVSGNSTTTTTTRYNDEGELAGERTESATTAEDGTTTPTGSRETTFDQNTGTRTDTTRNGKDEVTEQTFTGRATEGERGIPKPLSAQYDPTVNGAL